MKKLTFIIFVFLLQACANTDEEFRHRSKAYEHALLAERERSYGNIVVAQINEDIAKDLNKKADEEFNIFDVLLEIIFD